MNGSSGEYSYFWLYHLQYFTGLILCVAYVVFFLVPFSSILGGDAAFTHFMTTAGEVPLLGWVEALFVGVPLIFHIAFGLMIMHGGQINIFSYAYYKNWMYALERVTGLILIPFALYHIYATKLAFMWSGRYLDAKVMHSILTPAWSKSLYIAGIVCAAFYFGNGMAGGLNAWGIAATRRSRTAAAIAGWVLTLVLAAWGLRIVSEF
ncbi:MAG: hypothetical protein WC690_07585 [bacterium]